jgi:hypothetical protein
VPPVLASLIHAIGWRGMFVACGVFVLAMAPILYWILDEPGAAGGPRTLFGHKEQERMRPPEMPGITASQVMRSRTFWLLVVATIAGMAPRNWFSPHLVPMLLEKGFTEADAVTFVSGAHVLTFFGAAAAGYALDKIDDARIGVPFKATSFVGILLLSIATSSFGGLPLLMAAIAFWGFGWGTTRPMTTFMHIRFFGLKSFGFYYGFEMMLVAFVMGAGAPLVGLIADRTGSYQPAYIALLISLFLGAILYLFMGPYRYARSIGATPEVAEGEAASGVASSGSGPASQPN